MVWHDLTENTKKICGNCRSSHMPFVFVYVRILFFSVLVQSWNRFHSFVLE